jgi:hypothetical protein
MFVLIIARPETELKKTYTALKTVAGKMEFKVNDEKLNIC